MKPSSLSNLAKASRLFARKSTSIHASRPPQLNVLGKQLPPQNPPAPFQSSVTLPKIGYWEQPTMDPYPLNVSSGNPPPLWKKPSERDKKNPFYQPFGL